MYQKPMHPVQKLDLWKKTSEYFTENKNFRCPDCDKKYIMVNGKKHCDCNPLVVDDKKSTRINEEDERVDISLCDQALNILSKYGTIGSGLKGGAIKFDTRLNESDFKKLKEIIKQLKKREQAEQAK